MTDNTLTPWIDTVTAEELRRIVDALYRVHGFLRYINDLDTLLGQVMEESKAIGRAEACALMLHDAITGELYFQIALGEQGDQEALKREIRLQPGQGIAGAAAVSRTSINVPDVRKDPRFFAGADEKSRFETRSILAVPLVDKDNLVGVLELLNKQGGGPFTAADLHVMEIFANVVASAIANARLIEENLHAERLAALGQALAGLSHCAKNIITGLGGSMELIGQALSNGDMDVLRRCWPILRRSNTRLADFVEDMLAYSKPRVPIRETVVVQQAIAEAVDTMQCLLHQKEVTVHVAPGSFEGSFRLDPRGLYRCLLNLLKNAADAAPASGGAVWVATRLQPNGALVIEIADNGTGIPPEIRSRVLEPFFSTKGTQGTGLGLAVTAKIIEEHGGTLTADERPGGGALFRIEIPPANETETPWPN